MGLGRATPAPCQARAQWWDWTEVAAVSRADRAGGKEREKSKARHWHTIPELCWASLAKFSYVACLFVVL